MIWMGPVPINPEYQRSTVIDFLNSILIPNPTIIWIQIWLESKLNTRFLIQNSIKLDQLVLKPNQTQIQIYSEYLDTHREDKTFFTFWMASIIHI